MLANKEKFEKFYNNNIKDLITLTEDEKIIMRTNPDYCYEILTEMYNDKDSIDITKYLYEGIATDLIKQIKLISKDLKPKDISQITKTLEDMKNLKNKKSLNESVQNRINEIDNTITPIINLTETQKIYMATDPEFCYEVIEESFGSLIAKDSINYLYEGLFDKVYDFANKYGVKYDPNQGKNVFSFKDMFKNYKAKLGTDWKNRDTIANKYNRFIEKNIINRENPGQMEMDFSPKQNEENKQENTQANTQTTNQANTQTKQNNTTHADNIRRAANVNNTILEQRQKKQAQQSPKIDQNRYNALRNKSGRFIRR